MRALATYGVVVEAVETRHPGHATALARAAAADGISHLVAVGGDGTVAEVAAGLVADDAPDGARGVALGIAPVGSGSDLARTLGLPHRPGALAGALLAARSYPIDVGVAWCAASDGLGRRTARRVVVDVAEVGLGAEVVARAARLPRGQGRPRYPLAAAAALPSCRRVPTTVRTPSWTATLPLSALVVANGRHFGGGMRVAPSARVDDGVLGLHGGRLAALGAAVRLHGGRLGAAVRLYGGRHLPSAHIAVGRAAHVAVTTAVPAAWRRTATWWEPRPRASRSCRDGCGCSSERPHGVAADRGDAGPLARHRDPAATRSISSRATHQRRGRPRAGASRRLGS